LRRNIINNICEAAKKADVVLINLINIWPIKYCSKSQLQKWKNTILFNELYSFLRIISLIM